MARDPVVSSLFGPFDPVRPAPVGALFEVILGIEPILIEAPLGAVWAVMMDFDRYPEWNPLNRFFRFDTVGKVGEEVTFGYALKPPAPGGPLPEPERTQRESITIWQPPRCFAYADIAPGYKNERTQYIWSDGPARTWYVTHERFTGLLSPLIRTLYGARIVDAFRRTGLALKERAEASPPPRIPT